MEKKPKFRCRPNTWGTNFYSQGHGMNKINTAHTIQFLHACISVTISNSTSMDISR